MPGIAINYEIMYIENTMFYFKSSTYSAQYADKSVRLLTSQLNAMSILLLDSFPCGILPRLYPFYCLPSYRLVRSIPHPIS
jgi:hypothetical protein